MLQHSLKPDLPLVMVPSRQEWRAWLSVNYASSQGVWVVTYKKSSSGAGAAYVSARDINEECLCFGWIDSKPGKIDEQRTALLCTPRRPGSGWSKVNKDRLKALLERGLVLQPGLDVIERAKADGSWAALDEVDALIVPLDLQSALEALPPASENFAAFPPSARRGILEWISNAKRPDTRAERVSKTAVLAQENVRALEWKPSSNDGARPSDN